MGFLSFKVKGRRPRQIAAALRPAARSAHALTVADVLVTCQARVTVRTGQTRDSGASQDIGEMDSLVTFEHGGLPLEVGTRFMAAQPFAGPAVEEVRPRAHERLAAALEGTF